MGRGEHLALIAMAADLTRNVLSEAHLDAIAEVCRLPRRRPLDRLDRRETPEMSEATILVTGWGCPPVDAATLAAMPRLQLIAHTAGSVKRLVGPEVFARGIRLCHAADANAIPVAEFTLAAILLANKRALHFRDLYAKARRRDEEFRFLADRPIGNYAKTVGIVSASKIGRLVMERLRPFDLEVLLSDPFLNPAGAEALGAKLRPLEALFAESDVVSIHTPLLAETRGLIDAPLLARMKDGATLINTARGAIVDQTALGREVGSGRIDAWIDVTDPETPAPDNPLFDCPNVVLTPHIAGALGTERLRLGQLIVDEVRRYVAGAQLHHEVMGETFERIA